MIGPCDGVAISAHLRGPFQTFPKVHLTTRAIAIIVNAALFGAYLAGYVAAREASWVVHKAGFYTDADQKRVVAGHEVVPGDFGTPALAARAATVQALVAAVYLPARAVEAVAWRIAWPAGTEWPILEAKCTLGSDWDRQTFAPLTRCVGRQFEAF